MLVVHAGVQALERQEHGRRRAGGASVRAVARGSWRCGQVLSGKRSGAGASGQCMRACVARSERARRGNRRVRALAPGERGSWVGTGVGASTAQMHAA
jgi:hypothetical protein